VVSVGKEINSLYLPDLIIFYGSIDAQWIVAKKDWREAKKRYKEQEGKSYLNTTGNGISVDNLNVSEEPGEYQKDMDDMRCILYAHGGLFGLVLFLTQP
jgi:hypothetical protein